MKKCDYSNVMDAVSIAAIMAMMALLSFLVAGCASRKIAAEKIYAERMIADDNFLQEDADRFMASIAKGDVPVYSPAQNYTSERYVIKSWERDRECLWNIAVRKYGNPWRWHEIYAANADTIGINPDLIIEGEILYLPILSIDKK